MTRVAVPWLAGGAALLIVVGSTALALAAGPQGTSFAGDFAWISAERMPISFAPGQRQQVVVEADFPVDSILRDDFESNAIGAAWTAVEQEGDALVTISTQSAHSGSCAGKFVVSAASTSRGYIYRDLGGNKTDVWASGWFDVVQAGSDRGSNVPYIRFFSGPDLETDRVADLYRFNGGGDAWLRTSNGSGGWNYVQLNVPIPLNTWHQVALHLVPNRTASTIQVWIDGVLVYSNPAFNLHSTTSLYRVLLGAEHYRQQMVELFDDVIIGAS